MGPSNSSAEPVRVLFLISEIDPLIKIGGLGDVGGSLPPALKALQESRRFSRDLDLRVIIPFYPQLRQQNITSHLVSEFSIDRSGVKVNARVYQSTLGNIPIYLIDGNPVANDSLVYSSNPLLNGEKFTFYSLVALEFIRKMEWRPNIVHANDWHTCMAVSQIHAVQGKDPFFRDVQILLTIHNLPYMGNDTATVLAAYGLAPSQDSNLPAWARHLPLPMGIAAADWITTPSPSYANEIMTTEFGCGLEKYLYNKKDRISGILNGLDTKTWNPSDDPLIPRNYSLEMLGSRSENKLHLLREFGLDEATDLPLLAFIGRIDPQKGVDLAIDALRLITDTPWQMLFLGVGSPTLEEACRRLQDDFPYRVRTAFRYDAQLSHRVYAGADILLIPSRYEPCGLVQMIAMHYGCIPLANSTGGLKDTIRDPENSKKPNGFLFHPVTPAALAGKIKKTIQVYSDPTAWQALQRQAMSEDFSWDQSAAKYLKLYERLLS